MFFFLLALAFLFAFALLCVGQNLVLSRLSTRYGLQPSRPVERRDAAFSGGWTARTVELLRQRAQQETRRCGFVASEVGHFVRIAHLTHVDFLADVMVFNPAYKCVAGAPMLTVYETHEICNTTRRRRQRRCESIEARWDHWEHTSADAVMTLSGSVAFCFQRLLALHDGVWPCTDNDSDDDGGAAHDEL